MNLTQAKLNKLIQKQFGRSNKSKFGNHKIIINGEKIADSKHEYARLVRLKAAERIGEIRGLQTQVRYNLIPVQKICGVRVRGTDYVADFVYWTKDDRFICEDAKGHKTADYIIKRKLMKMIHNIDVVEV